MARPNPDSQNTISQNHEGVFLMPAQAQSKLRGAAGQKIYLIDAIGPFFSNYPKWQVNWSKIPFHHLQLYGSERRAQFDHIAAEMAIFAARVAEMGFNSVSIDDLAHLVPDDWYEDEVNTWIEEYRAECRTLFEILGSHGLSVFITMDVLSFTPRLKSLIGKDISKGIELLRRQIVQLFAYFPQVAGIIIRIGECDGKDVKGPIKSRLFCRTPRQVNRLLRALVPLFEEHGRTMIMRTWTVGAYQVGDFIWNHRTVARVLKGIHSPCLIISMKYGDSDFFRFHSLNKLFFQIEARTLLELQARREYEGCGEYPSFIGWDYRKFADNLAEVPNPAGISVWCQTGGWVPFRRRTFLDDASLWNELNVFVTMKIFREDLGVEEAVAQFCQNLGCQDHERFLHMLALSDQVIKELLYIPQIAELDMFFRRVRIPPLLNVYWNNIFINHSVRKVMRALVDDHESCVQSGYATLAKIATMRQIAEDLDLPVQDIEFMADTFFLIALAREYYFRPYSEDIRKRIQIAKKNYKVRYPKSFRPRYRIKTNFSPVPIRLRTLKLLLKLAVRSGRGYRLVDHLILIHGLGLLYRLIRAFKPKTIPRFVRKQAMGIGTIFK